jgi:hypothetical protein
MKKREIEALKDAADRPGGWAQVEDLDAIAINRKERTVVLSDFTSVRWTHMFADGEETTDPFNATSAVAPLPDGRWITVDLTAFGNTLL